jgi:peptide/nickel transport system permease protein
MTIAFVLRRVLQMTSTLALIILFTFLLVRLLPGDPLSAVVGDKATDAQIEQARAEYGLDQSLVVQFTTFFRHVALGDLGNSYTLREPVRSLLVERLPPTLILTAMAVVIGLALAVPLAVVAALKREGPADMAIRGAFQVGLSMPAFYLGLTFLTVFAAQLRWFPVGGYGDDWLGRLYHLFLPALTLGVSLASMIMRSLRGAIVEVLDAEYVTFARAKGLAPSVIVVHHVLRNALISTVALMGPIVGSLLGGAVITETVFAIPGIGRLMIDSIYARDYPVVQGLTLAIAVSVSIVFLLTDLLQAALDPRLAR